jgi:hypothetical protein
MYHQLPCLIVRVLVCGRGYNYCVGGGVGRTSIPIIDVERVAIAKAIMITCRSGSSFLFCWDERYILILRIAWLSSRKR